MELLLKYEIELYKALRKLKRRVEKINKIYKTDKTEALLNAYCEYEIRNRIISLNNFEAFTRTYNSDYHNYLNDEKLKIVSRRHELQSIEQEFKKC